MTKLILIYCLLILINACVTRGASHGDLNGKWKVIGYSFSTSQEFPIEKMTIDLTITDHKKIGGRSGCNIFGGELTILPGHKIKVGPLTSTEMFCDELTGQFERSFLGTLQNATDYSLENEVLTFSDPATKNFLRFARVREVKPASTPVTEERMTFFVSNRKVNCGENTTTKCLQIKTENDSVWHVMREPITGFEFKPGRFYKIEVSREKAPNEPNKPSVYTYKLARVVKSVKNENDLYK